MAETDFGYRICLYEWCTFTFFSHQSLISLTKNKIVARLNQNELILDGDDDDDERTKNQFTTNNEIHT